MNNLEQILKHEKEGYLVSPSSSNKKKHKVHLYRLELNPPNADSVGFYLPTKYDSLVDNCVFAIPPKALTTIKHFLNIAPSHWRSPLYSGYDTNVRESLMEIGEKMIEKAFYLIFDYLYNPETEYYMRSNDLEKAGLYSKHTLFNLALFSFWNGRTGRGLQINKSKFMKSWWAQYNNTWAKDNDYHVFAEVSNYCRRQETQRPNIADEGPSEGPVEGELEKTPIFLYNVKIDYTDYDENTGEAWGAGATKYYVCAENKTQAEKIALNDFYYLHQGQPDKRWNYSLIDVNAKAALINSPIIKLDEIGIINFDESQNDEPYCSPDPDAKQHDLKRWVEIGKALDSINESLSDMHCEFYENIWDELEYIIRSKEGVEMNQDWSTKYVRRLKEAINERDLMWIESK